MRHHRAPILLGVATVAAALVAVVAQTALSSPASRPVCRTSQLRGKLLDSNGAAGTILFSVTLQNKGSACELKGYPALRIKGTHGSLPTHVVHGGMSMLNEAPKLVKLAHLDKASVLISFEDVPARNETTCPSGKAIRIRPPGASGWLIVKAPTTACSHGTLHVSPILAGARSSM